MSITMGRLKLMMLAVLLIGLCLSSASPARADDITLSLTTDITGPVGSTITVYGDMTNTTSNDLYFSDEALNLPVPSTVATGAGDVILNGLLFAGPTMIGAGSTLDNVDLFTIQLLGGAGTYSGNLYDLIGGTDPLACSIGTVGCDTDLGSTSFSFNVTSPTAVPEPSSLLLLGSGLASLVFLRRKANYRDNTVH
jgi:PEP-CTERM motif-containing protein